MSAHLLFELAGQRYALDVQVVIEVTRMVSGVALPSPPPLVEAAVDFHGRVVPVLDVRTRFGLPAKTVALTDRLIVATTRGRLVALRVDQALDVIIVDAADVDRADEIIPGLGRISGVMRTPTGLVLIHDLDTFLSSAEAEGLDGAFATAAGLPA